VEVWWEGEVEVWWEGEVEVWWEGEVEVLWEVVELEGEVLVTAMAAVTAETRGPGTLPDPLYGLEPSAWRASTWWKPSVAGPQFFLYRSTPNFLMAERKPNMEESIQHSFTTLVEVEDEEVEEEEVV